MKRDSLIMRILFWLSKPFQSCRVGGWQHRWFSFHSPGVYRCLICDKVVGPVTFSEWQDITNPKPPQGGSGTACVAPLTRVKRFVRINPETCQLEYSDQENGPWEPAKG
jgi:hypothetical protein